MFVKKPSKIVKNASKIGSERPTAPFWSQMAPKTRKGTSRSELGKLSGILSGNLSGDGVQVFVHYGGKQQSESAK